MITAYMVVFKTLGMDRCEHAYFRTRKEAEQFKVDGYKSGIVCKKVSEFTVFYNEIGWI